MEPILSRQEIADLLSAIKAGQVSTESAVPEQAAKFTNADTINLFHMANKSSCQLRIPNLDIILDAFAQNYSVSLTNQLQRTFNINRISIDCAIFNEFMASQANSGAIGVLGLDPLKCGCLFILDKQLSFTMLEIMLGASSELDPLQLERKLTTIELNILKAIVTRACDDLSKALRPLINLKSTLIKIESNSRLVSITESDAEVVIGRFKIQIGSLSGELKLLFPVATLDPLKDRLRDLLSVRTSSFGEWSEQLIHELLEMSTTVIAQSGTITMPLSKVISFKQGDIIPLDYDPNSPLKVLIEDNLKFFARPGVHAGKRAISLTGVYQ